MTRSNRIEGKYDPDTGAGIEFELHGKQCITLSRTREKRAPTVSVEITTWKDIVFTSEGHFYASLRVSPCGCKELGGEGDTTFTSNMQPEESRGIRMDVTAPAKETIYGGMFGRKMAEVEKGQLTGRFTNVEDCIEAVEAVFDKIFGPPWVLYQGCTTTTWEEYKAELLADYGR